MWRDKSTVPPRHAPGCRAEAMRRSKLAVPSRQTPEYHTDVMRRGNLRGGEA